MRLAAQQKKDAAGSFEGLAQDLRYSLRTLLKRPSFALVTAMTLGLGIGASTTIFSAVHAVLFRPLPYGEIDRIVAIYHENSETGERGNGLSAANARDLNELSDQLAVVAVADPFSLDLEVEGRATSLRTWSVSEGFFEIARVTPYLGRTFAPNEHVVDSEPVVVVGYRSWLSRFGGDRELVGRTLRLDGTPMTVVGVLPAEFKLPDEAELWVPRPQRSYDGSDRAADYMMGIARLAAGSSQSQAAAEAARIAKGLAEVHPRTNATTTFRLVPLREFLFGDVRTPLLVLGGAVGLLLLIACANVAGLMLARGTDRRREYALRGALGATAGRLVRHVFIDSLLLAASGCALGVALAYAGIQLIASLGPDHLPRIEEIRVDGTVLAFAVIVSGLSALLTGLAPSLRLSRPDLRHTLTDGAGATSGRSVRSIRDAIVVVEVAAAMVLLVGAGLLSRSFVVLLDEDLGFDPTNRLALQVFAYGYGEEGGQTRAQFFNQAIEEMEAIPGVRRVALTSSVPGATDDVVASIEIDLPFTIEDRAAPPEVHDPEARVSMVSDSYFDVMAIPVVAGRGFTPRDDRQAPAVVVINEALARRHFFDGDPLGEKLRIGFGERTAREIVGIVADVRPSGYESQPMPEVYFPLPQQGTGSLTFILQTDIEAARVTGAANAAIWRANPSQSIWGAATLETMLSDWLKERSFNLLLLGSFALIALLLAAVGVYGLISFSIEQRVGELGIRRALGGQHRTIVSMLLREATSLAALGVVLGGIGAVALARFIQGMLFGVEVTDPSTFVILAVTVLGVAALAAIVPARRAMRIDPIVALRND